MERASRGHGALLSLLASLLVTCDIGGGKDADCAAMFQDVNR